MRRKGENCNDVCADCSMYSWPRRRVSRLVDVATADSRHTLDRHIRSGYFPSAESMPLYNCCELPSQYTGCANGGHRPLRFGFLGRLIDQGSRFAHQELSEPSTRAGGASIGGTRISGTRTRIEGDDSGCPEVCWLGFVSPECCSAELMC